MPFGLASVSLFMAYMVSSTMLLDTTVLLTSGAGCMQMGYIVYRRVIGYYSGHEDALDMRKAMPRDTQRKSVIPLKHPIYPHQLESD